MFGRFTDLPYAGRMKDGDAFIQVVIDVSEPIALEDFVRAFTSIAAQYRRFMRQEHPDLKDDAQIYVREVRPGSIIADLLPAAASLVGLMDQANIVATFVQTYGHRLSQYFKKGGRADDASKSDVRDFMGQVSAIARSRNGRGQIRAAKFAQNATETMAVVEFHANEARLATDELEQHKSELDAIRSADHERVLMVFKRSDIGEAELGVRSGERVIVEDLSERDLPLIYASSLAEERIKDIMRNTEENVFHKGFVVDLNVTTRAGQPVAYAVTSVHQIIDLE